MRDSTIISELDPRLRLGSTSVYNMHMRPISQHVVLCSVRPFALHACLLNEISNFNIRFSGKMSQKSFTIAL